MKVLKFKNSEGKFEDLYGVYKEPEPDPFNGYDYVDMGEAGIWATCNVGASAPEEYGLYFSWGETEGYPDASGNKKFKRDDYKFGDYPNLIKYNSSDNLTILELEDDAAHVNMGGSWRMPTVDEFKKLTELCNSEWTDDYNGTGVSGRIIKLKTDESKQLFFPAAGFCNFEKVSNVESYSYIWLSSLQTSDNAYYVNSSSSYISISNGTNRYRGLSIRGFIPKS